MFRRNAVVVSLLLANVFAPALGVAQRRVSPSEPLLPPPVEPRLLESLRWREVGPYRGGRSAAVAGVPSQPLVYYFGSTGGGVWKTSDGGVSWGNVSDGFFGGSIGAVAVSESDPNVVYVGGGEKTVRGNVSHGDGVWKSTDAGATWKHVGLADSRHVPRIRVDPRDPGLVYAAVLGHSFGPSAERGVYRSRDGGQTWQRVLFVNRDAGAIDLALDPTNPRVLYASTWRVRRTPWSLESGGEGSALWKSTDGGDTWKELSRNQGMPAAKGGKPATLGIIGVTVSPSNPRNLYAIVEAEEGGVFRSRDGGDTWERTSDSRDLRQRAWYYSRVVADPADEDAVYVLNVAFHYSKDGGKTFGRIRTPHSDNHDLWIAPDDPRRMIESNDGGANVSFDGGRTWSTQSNQPTAQMYRVSTDNAFPYRLLGGQQDNSAIRIRHRSDGAGIGPRDFEETAGGESGHVVAHPRDPDIVFGGSYGGYLTMVNHRTQEFRDVNAWPDNPMGHGAEDLEARFQWNFPILASPHAPDTLYAGANRLFRTTDRGASWQAISGDLTRNDRTRMGSSGGPITKDNTSVEYYGTIFAMAESPRERGVLWAGSDDGLVQLSRDGGESWSNVTPKQLPEWSMINCVEADPFAAGGAYVAATRYKLDDFEPFLFRTSDYGASWTRIDGGIARDHFTRAVRADPVVEGLLYAGTERGAYVSFDGGRSWQSLQLAWRRGGLPIVPITDLAVKEGDLIVATQGRGYWILDDLGLLRQLARGRQQARRLFEVEPAWRLPAAGGGSPPRNQGTNPANGLVVHYDLHGVAEKAKVKLEFLAGEQVLRSFEAEVKKEDPVPGEVPARAMGAELRPASPATSEASVQEGQEDEKPGPKKPKKGEVTLPARPGLNRFVWDLRTAPAEDFEGMVLWAGGEGELIGPAVVPGDYMARLTVAGEVYSTAVTVQVDPRSSAPAEDLRAQYAFLTGARDALSRIHRAIARTRRTRGDLDALLERLPEGEAAKPLRERIEAVKKTTLAAEEALYQTKNKSPQDPLNFPIRLNDKLALLAGSVAYGDFAPTAQAIAVRDLLMPQIEAELAKLESVWTTDLPAINRLAAELAVPALPAREEKEKEQDAATH